jgi:hypothetical protein
MSMCEQRGGDKAAATTIAAQLRALVACWTEEEGQLAVTAVTFCDIGSENHG